ncbi:MAG: exo-alpha-sialidase [Phycisphaerae bacterium]|nr:exo-alpha-sialidase [Phycisphaerae bacterium]
MALNIIVVSLIVSCVYPGVSPEAARQPRLEQIEVYVSGADGYHSYRIPAIVVSKKGTLLAFCEGRKKSRADDGDIDLLLKRSADGGKTWSKARVVREEGGDAPITIGNPCPIVDDRTGRVHLTFCRNNQRAFYTHSDDDGATWAHPVEITESFKAFDFKWTRLATGPGHGLQLELGAHKGRLLVPVWLNEGMSKPYRAAVILSDDAGKTWHVGGLIGPEVPNTNECMAVETADGSVCLNIRARGAKVRSVAWSKDGGETFGKCEHVETLVGPTCQASIVRLTKKTADAPGRVLFANPASTKRERMTVRISDDEARTWSTGRLLHRGPAAYSDLCVLPDRTIGCLYERGGKSPYEKITFARFDLRWISGNPAAGTTK